MNGTGNFNIFPGDFSQRQYGPLKYLFDEEDPGYQESAGPDPLFNGRALQKVEDKPVLHPESQSAQFSSLTDSQLSSFKIGTVNADPARHCPEKFNEIAVSLATTPENTDKSQSGPLNGCLAGTDKMPREQAAIKPLPAIESRTENISQINQPPVDDTESLSKNRRLAHQTGVSEKRLEHNARERKRTAIMRVAMDDLKERLCGTYFSEGIRKKKLKNVDVLRGAIGYIRMLNDILAKGSSEQSHFIPRSGDKGFSNG
ncbi:helix-loop-helix domain-containing protein [Endozoicomonas sp. ALC013]|uniref:helix-loop-helix domain-containing protein n=1 Tax=Endozoicomonas sp. ALC013 TaxID=3403076 RepID=UPI003BB4B2CC